MRFLFLAIVLMLVVGSAQAQTWPVQRAGSVDVGGPGAYSTLDKATVDKIALASDLTTTSVPVFAGLRLTTGSLGIGTVAPAVDLDVSGSIRSTNFSYFGDGTNYRAIILDARVGGNFLTDATRRIGEVSNAFIDGANRFVVKSLNSYSLYLVNASNAGIRIGSSGAMSATGGLLTVGSTGSPSASATGAGSVDIRGVLDVQGAAHGIPRLIQSERLGNTSMSMETVTIGRGHPVMRAGSITGLALAYDVTANTDGELEAVVNVMRAGSVQDSWLLATPLPSTVDDDLSFALTNGRGVVAFAAGDVIVVELVETNGSVTLRDVRATVEVVFD